jgi:hypothetical protein
MERNEIVLLRSEAQRRFAVETLKVCPLCGAVNAHTNGECFVCCWAGQFDFDPTHIAEGLDTLLQRCPELASAILETPRRTTGSLLTRFFRWVTGQYWRGR